MNKLLFIITIVISLSACSQDESAATKAAKDFQYKINLEYADKKTSPLTKEDFILFSSLNFFPINTNLSFEADFERTPNEKPFEMLTTTSRLVMYVKYGIAHFEIEGKKYQLNIYQNQELIKKEEYKDYLFLPFIDLTSGKESYAGGRYIDLRIPTKEKTITIDFNQAYNPYCAYNHKYSCPIPPSENKLDVAIKAGVMKFH